MCLAAAPAVAPAAASAPPATATPALSTARPVASTSKRRASGENWDAAVDHATLSPTSAFTLAAAAGTAARIGGGRLSDEDSAPGKRRAPLARSSFATSALPGR